jgi:D-alanyl-D-alanine carboxypeptidase
MKTILYSFILAVFAIGITLFLLTGLKNIDTYPIAEIQSIQTSNYNIVCNFFEKRIKNETTHSLDKDILAKAVFVYDFDKKNILYERNSKIALPLASITKLMTIRIALENLDANNFYTITKEDLGFFDKIKFSEGDRYLPSELVKSALIQSSNASAVILANKVVTPQKSFIEMMNNEAKNLGLNSLHYNSVTGLDFEKTQTASVFGSATDVVKLLYADWKDFPKSFGLSSHSNETITSADGKVDIIANSNSALPDMPLLVASKTGYTTIAGGNIVVLWKGTDGDLLGASILGSTKTDRYGDIKTVYGSVNSYLTNIKLFKKICG